MISMSVVQSKLRHNDRNERKPRYSKGERAFAPSPILCDGDVTVSGILRPDHRDGAVAADRHNLSLTQFVVEAVDEKIGV